MDRHPGRRWGPPLVFVTTGLVFGAGQLLAFPPVASTPLAIGAETAFVLVVLAGFVLVGYLDTDPRTHWLLNSGLFSLLLHATTDAVDEVARPPLAFTVVFEHGTLLVGTGLLFAAIWRWGRLREDRGDELGRTRDLLRRTESMASVGGWAVDLETEELQWTEGTYRIHDVPTDRDPTLQEALSYFHSDDREHLEALIEECRETGAPYQAELRLVTADRRIRWVQVTGEAITEDGSVVALIGTVQDVTPEMERQQQLSVLNRVLRHNLRNELNLVMGRAETLLDELAGTVQQSVDGERVAGDGGEVVVDRGTLDRLETNARSIIDTTTDLNSLGEKIRQYSELTVDGETREATALAPLLEAAGERGAERDPYATVRVSCTDDLTALAEPVQLETAVGELVENAVLHSDVEEPTVHVDAQRTGEDRVAITVRDRGPGIPEQERSVLRKRGETELTHGSGLGLWIANWLVGHQDGTLRIADNEPRGTVVTVTLPSVRGRSEPESS